MYNKFSLVDTHRHLGGSVSIDFLLHAITLGACPDLPYNELKRHMVCLPDEPKEFNHFLSKFKFLDKIKWDESLVADKIRFVCNEIANEQLTGVFLDFSVSKYRHIGWSLTEAMNFILDRMDEYSTIPIVPILSIKYESPDDAQHKIAQVIENSSIASRVGGIDFVGDESKFDPRIQAPICEMWQGKLIRLHVGESQSAINVAHAIDMGATNIAHGIKIVDAPELLRRCTRLSNITFDIAPTSNYITGVVGAHQAHPGYKMFKHGVRLTIGSDDPIQCSTDIHKEYALLLNHGFSDHDLQSVALNGHEQLRKWIQYSVGSQTV